MLRRSHDDYSSYGVVVRPQAINAMVMLALLTACSAGDARSSAPTTSVTTTVATTITTTGVATAPARRTSDITESTERPSGWIITEVEALDYVCAPAVGRFGSFDCTRYYGFVPASVALVELRCSERPGSYECTSGDYYPSELDGLEVAELGWARVLRRDGHCWIWSARDTPSHAALGTPDFNCGW